ERLEIPANRASRDAADRRQFVDRDPRRPRPLDFAEHRPLADDFGVSRHTRIVPMIAAFLFFVAWVGGVLNAVAGGGSFLSLPALLYAGVAPVSANATTTMALWPGSVSSAFAYRRDIEAIGTRRLIALGAVSLVGGLLGGYLLIRTSDASFMRLLPWLMLLA